MEAQKDGKSSTVADLSKEMNRTYVISAVTKCGGHRNATCHRDRLTLQRRKTGDKGVCEGIRTSRENAQNHVQASYKRATLQRRTRTRTMDKDINASKTLEKTGDRSSKSVNLKGVCDPNSGAPSTAVLRSVSLKDSGHKNRVKESINHDKILANGTLGPSLLRQKVVTQPNVDEAGHEKVFSTPTRKTPFEKVSLKKDMFERLAGRAAPNATIAEKQRRPRFINVGVKDLPQNVAQSDNSGLQVEKPKKNVTLCSQTSLLKNVPVAASSGQNSLKICAVTASSDQNRPESGSGRLLACGRPRTSTESSSEDGIVKQEQPMENSAVTVAVRLRPFSGREKNERAQQVVFMNNQETLLQYPDSRQCYSFIFDFSFCSIDETKSGFASQQTVYEKLARPLLERAFEGYNTCLFAYGQTGSGKSYTMMGFDEEPGVVPRFCEEIFTRIHSENKQITCHLEMSYFEVYNEKIHDLLVVKDEQSQKKLPLRVREHPVYGPYVADLSANVVSSFTDIQGWLELGNKQRATVATGMNDKSSRSHSVFTLVMSQTKTEFVEEEEHDHRITSRINLVDLAGSERSSSAQTSGDRLREGASINKSLLTLGKVISALSERFQTKKKVFIPYRESVLTWLLKESLGGNSKTAMIATLSPAASSIEETLGTLRYAKQARTIINVAKVNEDTNAKLIRELKAEVEKLKAAQMSSQGIDPATMRLFQQEMAALRMQLTQQEREMAEAHRTWKEKLDQSEKRKQVETKELQKAGITFKVDNRLPNLVNLNEDPQLSEMLLYMIKEGETKVGKHKCECAHDIQLSGALIADEHCVISNLSGTVSITPIKDAKTFVNGNLISRTVVLHHGDRVILGGDHYFRFNHPVEVHGGKRVSRWTAAGDGHKDFEFAKNELLAAQRAQLEAEIEEARLKAKEEMMLGIQVAKELAQKELSDQKAVYENRIRTLQRELEEESQRKKCQELDTQRAANRMEELQSANIVLEQKLQVNKRHLLLEAQAAREAMADHDVRHAKIIEALEAEKRKIADDLERIQNIRQHKENHVTKSSEPQWDAMKLSVLLEEANTISRKLSKSTLFSRHESSDEEGPDGEVKLPIQVQNTKLGISTFWSLEKFQSKLARMRELEQGECASKDDDVFYDPNDEWEQDMSVSVPASTFSRRRSRSLLKTRRISGRLYEIRVHPIQSLLGPSQHTGLMGVNKPPSPLQQNMPNSVLPGICKDLVGSALAQLQGCHGVEDTVADKLTFDLFAVHTAIGAIGSMFESLDDDCQENLFASNRDAQMQLVKATSAIERAVLVTLLWTSSIKQSCTTMFYTADRLKSEVKKLGGYFQLLIQGCDSEISSMVTEAQDKTSECLNEALRLIGHLSAILGTELRITEAGSEATDKHSVTVALYEGICKGVASLVQEGIGLAKEMHRQTLQVVPNTQILQILKDKISEVASSLNNTLSNSILQEDRALSVDSHPDLLSLRTKAVLLFQLNTAMKQLHSGLTQILREKDGGGDFASWRRQLYLSSKTITNAVNELFENRTAVCGIKSVEGVRMERGRVPAALRALLVAFDTVYDKGVLRGGEGSVTGKGHSHKGEETSVPGGTSENHTVHKMVYTLSSENASSPRDIQWV